MEQLWVSALVETRGHGHVPRLPSQRLPEDVQPLGPRHAHWSQCQPPMSPGVAVTLTRGLTSVRSVLRTQTLRGRWWMEVRASPTASFSLHTRDMREKNESLKMFSSKYCVTSSLKLENYSRARKRERGSPTSSWYFHLLFSSAFSSLRWIVYISVFSIWNETSQAVTKHLHSI